MSATEQPTKDRPARTFRLTLAYDGTDFFGWQVQPGLPTIQGTLAETVEDITGDKVLPQGSGRTDTGVHAEGQVVSLPLRAAIPADRLHRALNRRLPASIRVMECVEAAPGFHARANVLHKTYEYRIFQRRVSAASGERPCPPALARYVWDCRWPLQMEPMRQIAGALIGTHDFTAFAASDPDRARRAEQDPAAPDNVRTVLAADWQADEGMLRLSITGTGFLHHMVRNIVGTCVEAGAGRFDPTGIAEVFAARDRSRAGATAPPQGLHLMRVVYREDDAA